MAIASRPIRTKIQRSSHQTPVVSGPGPYVAKVVSHLDPTFMGGLRVQILKVSSNPDEDSSRDEIVTAYYAPPFFGSTPVYGVNGNNSYSSTQQSYGFWAVPPDVGTRVLVIFVEGKRDYCFWFACIPDEFMNFMVPDSRVATSVNVGEIPGEFRGRKLPVGEYNKAKVDPQGQNQPTYYQKPVNSEFANALFRQGLIEDDFRGLSTSSARRETPSAVFGISTPGPLDKNPGAPRIPKGPRENEAVVFSSRLGGHSLVMDDGDDKLLRRGSPEDTPSQYANKERNEDGGDVNRPANELFRIRTRTGHQILLHNSEDLIYISNARGTAWIELTSNGKIDIYAQDSISIHSQNDLNFTADRDINFNANENINMLVGKELRIDAGNQIGITSGNQIALNAETNVSISAGDFFSAFAESSANIIANNGVSILSPAVVNIGSETEVAIEGCNLVKISTDGDFHTKSLQKTFMTAGNDFHVLTETNYFLEATSNIHETAGVDFFRKAQQTNDLSSTKHTIGSNATFIDSPLNVKNNIITPQTVRGSRVEASSMVETPHVKSNVGSTGASVPSPSYSGTAPTAASPATPAELPTAPDPVVPEPPTRAQRISRIPQHEPWAQHENADPTNYTPDKTRAGSAPIETYPAPLPDTFLPPQSSAPTGQSTSGGPPPVDRALADSGSYSSPLGSGTNQSASRGTTEGPSMPIGDVAGAINGFTIEETKAYLDVLGQRESNNSYDAENTLGFLGKYQFGAAALEDLGYIKPGTFARRLRNLTIVSDPQYWTGKDGITSKAAFKDAKAVQERAIIEYTNRNLRTLRNQGVIRQGDTKAIVSGLLMAAHLKGPGDVRKWRAGASVGTDAYGTSISEYYGLGRRALNDSTQAYA